MFKRNMSLTGLGKHVMKNIFKKIACTALAASALAACTTAPRPMAFARRPMPLMAQNVLRAQNGNAQSIGQAKAQLAAQLPPVPAQAAQGPQSQANVVTPDWVKDAIFYQIFPERFQNGNRANDPEGSEPWGSKPKLFNFMGGDLDGVIQKLPYLKDLGVNAIYFNPLFEAPTSNHKYDTANYMKIDPSFGDMDTFRTLIREAHKLGIKVLLDAVFNHSGDSHWAFKDAEKNGPESKYWNWYLFHGFPVVKSPKPNYESWWGFASLPKFNEYNPEVREHLFKVAEFWSKEGIDGWRLDVPNEVRDMNFWREFRSPRKAYQP